MTAEELKEIRTKLDFTQQQFSQMLNVSLRQLIRYEKDDARVPEEVMFRAFMVENMKTRNG